MNTPHTPFLAQARTGRHETWRVIVGILLPIFGLGLAFLAARLWVIPAITGSETLKASDLARQSAQFIVTGACFFLLLVGTLIAVKWVLRRKLSTVFRAHRFNWWAILEGIVLWGGLMFVCDLIFEIGLLDYVRSVSITPTILIAGVIAVVCVMIQGMTEEVLFRGYLLQLMSLRMRRIWLLVLVNSVIFGLLHAGSGLHSFIGTTLFGVFFCLIALREQNLGFAIGVHFINNFYLSFLFGGFFEAQGDTGLGWNLNFATLGYLVLSQGICYGYLWLRNRWRTSATRPIAAPVEAEWVNAAPAQ